MKKILALILVTVVMVGTLAGCQSQPKQEAPAETEAPAEEPAEEPAEAPVEAPAEEPAEEPVAEASAEPVDIQVFIAASLNTVMTEVAAAFNEENPDINVVFNADSSGTLLTQIQEGFECDIFFSAAQKQMDTLEEDGLVIPDSRANVVNNQVVVISYKDSGTAVTGLENLKDAKSIALAGGSVPVGRYTRVALMKLGLVPEVEKAEEITTAQISEALSGVEISEQDNVSKVLIAVSEQSCEVGTTYYSDTYGYEDEVDVLQTVGYDLTGDVIYPIALVDNDQATDAQFEAAKKFHEFVLSDKATEIFKAFYFDTNVE